MSGGGQSDHLASWPTATTRPVVLLGWPARHSLSPVLHNAAFRAAHLDLVYLALPVKPDDLAGVVASLGAIDALGANVTVPHKQAVVAACDQLSAEAELIGAVNTLVFGEHGLWGDNTDALGLRDALVADAGVRAGDQLLVFGTGGAARASVVAAGRLGCPVTIVGRRPAAAEELAALARRADAPASAAVDLDDEAALAGAVARARVVINATPLGMAGEALPGALQRLRAHQVAYDLVTTTSAPDGRTPFLAAADAAGAGAHHGLGMLVGQAAASYRRWTGQWPPGSTMSDAACAALEGP